MRVAGTPNFTVIELWVRNWLLVMQSLSISHLKVMGYGLNAQAIVFGRALYLVGHT